MPDMTTLGVKTVIAAYGKTKQGAFTQAVSTFYTLEVTSAVVSLGSNYFANHYHILLL